MSIPEDLRRRLMTRCGSRGTRLVTFSSHAPSEWQPRTLRDPRRPEEYFTDDSAWLFIAEHLAEGASVEVVELRKPPGKTGYVLVVPGVPPILKIYIKLQLGSDCVIGRSFHESKPSF